jgi:N-acetylmuramoyl-L-alanine amidase
LGEGHVYRLGGVDRYDTARKVSEWGVAVGMNWDGIAIGTGQNYPDALAAGPMQGEELSVMALTKPLALSPPTYTLLSTHKNAINTLKFLGSSQTIVPSTRQEIRNAIE